MNNNEMIITRIFDVPREKVWKAWTDPEYIKRWWGPKDFTAPSVEIDFRQGGKYLYCMRGAASPGGPIRDFWSGGVFQEIVEPKKIVATDYFTDEKGNKVSAEYYGMSGDFPEEMTFKVKFEKMNGKTELAIKYANVGNMSETDRTNMQMGWNQSLDKLEEVLNK